MHILVVAPHPDDEVLGCGGIIAKQIAVGHSVYVAVMTNGHAGAPQLFSKEQVDSVRNEARTAHQFLGVKETYFFEFPAIRLETEASYLMSNELNALFRKLDIDTLYLPHRGDIHKDHTVVFNAALVAARPINNCTVKNIYTYETLSETEWAAPFGSDVFIPNIFEDISDFISLKLDAMRCFASQVKAFPHSRSLESIESLAKTRGVTVGYKYAEAFALIRSIR